jgi:hypothetical protein
MLIHVQVIPSWLPPQNHDIVSYPCTDRLAADRSIVHNKSSACYRRRSLKNEALTIKLERSNWAISGLRIFFTLLLFSSLGSNAHLGGIGTKGMNSCLTSSGILDSLLVSMFIITQVLQARENKA